MGRCEPRPARRFAVVLRIQARTEANTLLNRQQSLENELRNCAVELWQLAYTLQDGVGEHDLLRLSERMRAAADEVIGGRA
jgi:hypothetical protein